MCNHYETEKVHKIDIKTVKVYDQKSDDYVSLVKRPPGESLIAFTKAVKPGGLVLDLGCGPGMAAAFMRDSGLELVAVDASSAMIKIAKSVLKRVLLVLIKQNTGLKKWMKIKNLEKNF